jgi:hypothetical protein
MLLMLAQPASAAILTGSISDDKSDANLWLNKNKAIPDYLDILGATLALDNGEFTMTMDMVGAIPDEPKLFNGIQTLAWQWAFRAGGGSHPFSHWLTTDEDYMVWLMWDGKAWSAQLWDFVHIQESVGFFQVRDITTFAVHDNGVSVTMDSSWMDDFQACQWVAADKGFMSPPLKTDGFYGSCYIDWAGYDPHTGEFTVWPG